MTISSGLSNHSVSALDLTLGKKSVELEDNPHRDGALIINADDWGRDAETTNRILECVVHGSVSSASAMVFMKDSERGAALAHEHGLDVGLHMNFTTLFSAPGCPARLIDHLQQLSRFLARHRFAQAFFHPGLTRSFKYVVAAQLDEFHRLYNTEPRRIDGHHHMHLCANVLFGELIPVGTLVRRSCSLAPGEKSWMNRSYRRWVDRQLMRRHQLVDFLFSLAPVEPPDRLQGIVSMARHVVVELETHPINPEEYRFLTSDDVLKQIIGLQIAPSFAASVCKRGAFGKTSLK
jgi:chitin disaccharide deacetylase